MLTDSHMIDLATLTLFSGTSLLLALAPGPDNLFVLTQSALRGSLAGLVVTVGLCTGLLVHTTAVTLGVAAVLQTSPLAFNLLKYAGAAYLVYLAWSALRTEPAVSTNTGMGASGLWPYYLRGIGMNVTNPKVTLFFLAFLPQFTKPENGWLPLQLITLGGVFIAATLLVFGTISLLAGRIGHWLRRTPRAQQFLNKAAAILFVVLALHLLAAGR